MKLFPCNLKIPLISNWQSLATTDAEQLRLWKELYKDRLTHFGVPTGLVNNIFVLDVDVKGNGFETLKRFPPIDTLSQETPSGGRHYIFRYPNDGFTYGNRVKFLPGLDTRGIGGYIVWYNGDGKAIQEAPQWLLEEIRRPALTLVNEGPLVAIDPSIASRKIQEALDEIRNAPSGESNNTLNIQSYLVGQLVAASSVSREYAEDVLLKAAIERGKPVWEAKATIKSGLDGGIKYPLTSAFPAAPPVIPFVLPPLVPGLEIWTPKPFTREQIFDTTHLRRPQLFENWSTEDIHITTADGGTGKTTLKLFEAICLALGESFLGFPCLQPGKTLFITGEDTERKLGAMIGQIIKAMGIVDDQIKVDKILDSIVVKKDADLCLITKERDGFIRVNSQAFEKLVSAVDDIKPKMIVFDPISSFWGSEMALNDMNRAVTKFMSALVDRSSACVEMINHMGKSSSATKDMTQFAGRGGSGLPSNSRVSRVMRPIFDDEYMELTGESLDGASCIMCVVNKFTDGSPLYNKPFLILRKGFIFSRKSLSDAKLRETEREIEDLERVFNAIRDARRDGLFASAKDYVAEFATSKQLSKKRVEDAIRILSFRGHNGYKVIEVAGPDVTRKERVLVIADMQGREIDNP